MLLKDEQHALGTGAQKQRTFFYELALFTAWHMAAFNSQAKAGKLKSWNELRTKLIGTTDTRVPQTWQARKAERSHQIAMLKKHRAQRQKGPVKRGR